LPTCACTLIYTLSLHDALPISLLWHDTAAGAEFLWHLEETIFGRRKEQDILCQLAQIQHNLRQRLHDRPLDFTAAILRIDDVVLDRKSTRLNSSHSQISYAVFC